MIRFENVSVYNMLGAIRGARLSYGSRSDSLLGRLGDKDKELIQKLAASGPSHRKFMRQILVSVDITAPRYWWMQFDTYKVGVTTSSESTMHTIMKRPITPSDFSFKCHEVIEERFVQMLEDVRMTGNFSRLISLLPQSYNQKRHVTMNYEVIRNIREQRAGHKLSEWQDFIEWSDSLNNASFFFKPLKQCPEEPEGGNRFEAEP